MPGTGGRNHEWHLHSGNVYKPEKVDVSPSLAWLEHCISVPHCCLSALSLSAGLLIEEAVVFLDREQGGRQRLAALGSGQAIRVHAVACHPPQFLLITALNQSDVRSTADHPKANAHHAEGAWSHREFAVGQHQLLSCFYVPNFSLSCHRTWHCQERLVPGHKGYRLPCSSI